MVWNWNRKWNNNICEIISNNYFYTIHIPLDKILYNSLSYHDIKIHVQNYGQDNFDFYLLNFTSLKIENVNFTQQKNIQGLPIAEHVNYDFVKAKTLTDLLSLF